MLVGVLRGLEGVRRGSVRSGSRMHLFVCYFPYVLLSLALMYPTKLPARPLRCILLNHEECSKRTTWA
jgi:hypothetical protein